MYLSDAQPNSQYTWVQTPQTEAESLQKAKLYGAYAGLGLAITIPTVIGIALGTVIANASGQPQKSWMILGGAAGFAYALGFGRK